MCDSVWNDCVKPRIAAELGLPNATSSIYDAVVKIVEDLSVSDEQLKGIEAGDGIIVTETQDSYIISAEVARLTGTGAVSVEEVLPGKFTVSAPVVNIGGEGVATVTQQGSDFTVSVDPAPVQTIAGGGIVTVTETTTGNFTVSAPLPPVQSIAGGGIVTVTETTTGNFTVSVDPAPVQTIAGGGIVTVTQQGSDFTVSAPLPPVQTIAGGGIVTVTQQGSDFTVSAPLPPVQSIAGGGIVTVTETTTGNFTVSVDPAPVQSIAGGGSVTVDEVQPGQFTISAPPRQWQESRSTVGAKSVATLRPIANPTDITGVVATNSFSLSSSVNSTAYQIGNYSIDLQTSPATLPGVGATGAYSCTLSGENNTASGFTSVVAGGRRNLASGNNSTIAGGIDNLASGDNSTVVGGILNDATGLYCIVGAGRANIASFRYSTVSGGEGNRATGQWSAVVGGGYNIANNDYSFIGGGLFNSAAGQHSAITGGENNSANGETSTVSGGYGNEANGNYSGVGAGRDNRANSNHSFVVGNGNTVLAESTGVALLGTHSESLRGFTGGVQAGCGTPNNKRLACAMGATLHGAGMSSCDFVSVDSVGQCRYYEWDDETFLSLNQEEDSWAHGHPVTLRGNKIALAQQGDRVIGVTCPHLGFVSGAHEFEWQGKYVRNAFGALQTRVTHVSDMVSLLSTRRDEQQAELCLSLVEKLHSLDGPDVLDKLTLEEKELVAGAKVVPVAVPMLSPGYDQGREYVGRRHRKEWVPVCYKGEVRVRTSSLNLLGGCHVLESGDQVTVVNL